MNQIELRKWIEELIQQDKLYKFYKSKEWIELKEEVLREQHYECQECLKQGMLKTKKENDIENKLTVHHVQFVKKYPELALSKFFYYERC